MKCTMGDQSAKLTVLPSRTVFLCGKPMANISDHTSMVNLAPFGKCQSRAYPATASATAAAMGTLTPMPCVHNTPMPWMGGKTDYLIQGQPALLKSCKCTCMWGGVISITDDGQNGEGTQYVNRKKKENAGEIQRTANEMNGLTVQSVLDGIQLTLDLAGFAPGIGAFADLTNSAIYALRGDMLNAGLSLFAAVPGIGDAAAATKLVGKGLKEAKSLKNTQKIVKSSKFDKIVEKRVSEIVKLGKNEKKIGAQSAESFNNELCKKLGIPESAFQPPFKKGTEVIEVELEQEKKIYRFYTKGKTNAAGQWYVSDENMKKLPPEKIKELLALPHLPDGCREIVVPKGTRIKKGIAGPAFGSPGGAEQYFFDNKL